MKILILTGLKPSSANPIGGIFITRRLQELKKLGHQFTVKDIRTYYGPLRKFFVSTIKRILGRVGLVRGKGEAEQPYVMDGIEYTGLAVPSGLPTWAYEKIVARKIANILKRGGYEILHAHSSYPEGYLAVKAAEKCNIPVIVTSHGGDIKTLAATSTIVRLRLVEAITKASCAIFVSEGLLQDARRLGYSGENAEIIYNGYSTQIFKPKDKKTARTRFGIPESSKIVGYIGGLALYKRADAFVDLFTQILKMEPNAFFLLIGDGPFAPQIRKSADVLPIRITGFLPQVEISEWMAAFDVLILPSRAEGWGCVIKEAQAMGIPCVGSDSGGIPEAIGKGGVVVPDSGSDFIEKFARAVVHVLNNPPKSDDIIQCANGYTWEETVAQEVAVYQRAIGDASPIKEKE